jgi:hypothetical protein
MRETRLNQIKERNFQQNIFYLPTVAQTIPPCYSMKNTAASYSSLSVSQCNVTQIENLLAWRISSLRFSGCKSRNRLLQPAVGKTIPAAMFSGLPTSKRTQHNAVLHIPSLPSFQPVSHTRLFSSFNTSPHLLHSAVDHAALFALLLCPQRLSVYACKTVTTGHDG